MSHLLPAVQMVAMQYPGRLNRVREEPISDIRKLAQTAVDAVVHQKLTDQVRMSVKVTVGVRVRVRAKESQGGFCFSQILTLAPTSTCNP